MDRTEPLIIAYAIPTRRRPRWVMLIVTLAIVLTATPFVKVGGRQLVGFHYGVMVNNSAALCPDTVVSQVGSTIILSDGRTFHLQSYFPARLTAQLGEAQNLVFVDTKNGVVYGRVSRQFCGFSRPQNCQIVTIPLIRDDLVLYHRTEIAELRPPQQGANGP